MSVRLTFSARTSTPCKEVTKSFNEPRAFDTDWPIGGAYVGTYQNRGRSLVPTVFPVCWKACGQECSRCVNAIIFACVCICAFASRCVLREPNALVFILVEPYTSLSRAHTTRPMSCVYLWICVSLCVCVCGRGRVRARVRFSSRPVGDVKCRVCKVKLPLTRSS